jgi:hypothetical protein
MNPEPIDRIPNEILEMIFSNLSGTDLKSASLVNKRFLLLISDSPRLMRKWMLRINGKTTIAKKFPIRKYQAVRIDTNMTWLKRTKVPWDVIFPRIQEVYDWDFSNRVRRVDLWLTTNLLLFFPNLQRAEIRRDEIFGYYSARTNALVWFVNIIKII